MGATTANIYVLVIGLDPYRVPGPWDPQPVADAIQIGLANLTARGFHPEPCLLGLDGSDDIQARVIAALQTRPWDCVIVGGGIRTSEEQLELFESVINWIRQYAPEAAIAFNQTPHDLAEVATRSLRLLDSEVVGDLPKQ